jgi:hypothetical protein
LNQQPIPVNADGNITTGYIHSNLSSWGGSVIYGVSDKMYHMFVAQFTNGCPLSSWESNSFIMHATSPTPTGPYKAVNSVLPVFHHNPTISQAPDGTYLLYFIGANWDGQQQNCTKSSSTENLVGAGNTGLIGIAYSTSLNGPWSLLNNGAAIIGAQSWFTHPSNPSGPVFLSDGSVYLAFRGSDSSDTERLGMLTAPSWKGPYTVLVDTPLVPGWGEDPFLWQDISGNFHILFHALSPCGGHAFSANGKTWSLAPAAYDSTSKSSTGKTLSFTHRERPHLLMDSNNNPKYLYNGASFASGYGLSFTIVAELM